MGSPRSTWTARALTAATLIALGGLIAPRDATGVQPAESLAPADLTPELRQVTLHGVQYYQPEASLPEPHYDLTEFGVHNGGVVLGGPELYAWQGLTYQEFTQTSFATIRDRLATRMASWGLPRTTTDLIILNIEHPTIPAEWWRHEPGERLANLATAHAMLTAVHRRIWAARSVFPNARLALFGAIVPDALGRNIDTSLNRLDFMIRAANYPAPTPGGPRVRLYEHLDVITPVLYQKYGPGDETRLYNGYGVGSHLRNMVAQGVVWGERIADAAANAPRGPARPARPSVVPITSFLLVNGGSVRNGCLVEGRDLAGLIAELRNRNVREFAFWHHRETLQPNPGSPCQTTQPDRSMATYFAHHAINFQRADLNGDGLLNDLDCRVYRSLRAGDPAYALTDVDGDGDRADTNDWRTLRAQCNCE